MRWGEFILRLLVQRRNHQTISGDLLEEYHEHILPTRGQLAARLWYVRQILSFVSPFSWGLLIGAVLGSLQLLNTATAPLADDDGASMVLALAVILVLWMLASMSARVRVRSFKHSVIAGALAGLATMMVFDITSILRVNIFLDQIRHRDDWINLVARFEASGFRSLRVYANWEYLRGTPVILMLGAAAGGFCGAVAGAISQIGGKRLAPIRH
jgi:hypothetical protein